MSAPASIAPQTCRHTEGHTNRAGDYIDKHDCAYVDARNRCLASCWQEAMREQSPETPSLNILYHDKVNARMGTPVYAHAERNVRVVRTPNGQRPNRFVEGGLT